MICTSNWQLLIINYGAFETLDHIAWPISVRSYKVQYLKTLLIMGRLDNYRSDRKPSNKMPCHAY